MSEQRLKFLPWHAALAMRPACPVGFIADLCRKKHQEDDLPSAYLWHICANLSVQNTRLCLLVQIRVTCIYGLAVRIIEAHL